MYSSTLCPGSCPPSPGLAPCAILICNSAALTRYSVVTPKRALATFKQPITRPTDADAENAPSGPHKIREEIEVEVGDAGTLTRIFEGLGMSGWFRYEKYRTTFRLPASKAWANGLLIELDETPIGTFVELEGPASAIDRGAEELGFSKRDYVLKNYLALYIEDCRRKGEEPRHMLFPERKRSPK